jgi:putative DNA primase/helicase
MNLDKIKNLRHAGKGFTGDCPVCGYEQALSLNCNDGKQLVYCHGGGCSQRDLMRALNESGFQRVKAALIPSVRRKRDISGFIQKLWQQSLPASGTVVENYLQSRGICCAIPANIRYLPDCLHRPSGELFPAMLASVVSCNGELRALHRTFLAIDGSGKATANPPKMVLGGIKGYSTHLAPATDELIITEGIETGLSVMVATGKPVWAALSAGGIQSLILPSLPLASEITIAADADQVGMHAASIAAQSFREEGRKVKIATPPQGMDFNDVLREVVV